MPASTSVDLFLLRHGIAEQRCHGVDDSLRPLTEQGILRTMEVARRLRSLGFAADRLLSSPYLRAAQTAELAQQAGLAGRVEFESGLLPGRDSWPLLEGLVGRCLLVGHEPDLTHLAARLLGIPTGCLVLKKAGFAHLRWSQ
ncbi:MAG: phosphohistidine phosphatase SixA, partial [Cyanobacteriota bacterium]|nr:phosphohistidine phosphatase SixA [Cyanobacteriota bacterium]